jgi:hypothetical protein
MRFLRWGLTVGAAAAQELSTSVQRLSNSEFGRPAAANGYVANTCCRYILKMAVLRVRLR